MNTSITREKNELKEILRTGDDQLFDNQEEGKKV